MATVSAILVNANRRKGSKRYKPRDFVPDYLGERRRPRPQTQEELWQRIDSAMTAVGGS